MEPVTLDVERLVAGGDGLAHDADGRVTFVQGALPGERVRAIVVEEKRDFARARIVEVLEASPDRIEPPCPFVAAGCGGCDWQHVAPAAQSRLKAGIVADALARQAHVDVPIATGPELPATGYRTTVRGLATGGRFGFRHRRSHEPVPVGPCLVAHPLVEELIEQGRLPDGEVTLRAGAHTGERLAVVDGDPGAVSVPDDVRVVSTAALRAGERAWYHEELAGRRWRVSVRSFFQARPDGAEALVDATRAAAEGALHGEARLVDLYGGVGLFAGTLDPVGQVILVESSASAVSDARVNLRDRRARVVKADVGRWRPPRADVVVADPPRAGLGRGGVAAVAATRAPRVVLVSCDPASLGRDTRLLSAAGYALRSATVMDLFPQTSHVEVVARFDRA